MYVCCTLSGFLQSGATSTSETDAETRRLKAFARISSVERGSPADQAGLRSEDLITNFGSIHIDNFNGRNLYVINFFRLCVPVIV